MAREHVELYEDVEGKWRWRRRAGNGEIVGESGQGYSRKSDAKEMAGKVNPGVRLEELKK